MLSQMQQLNCKGSAVCCRLEAEGTVKAAPYQAPTLVAVTLSLPSHRHQFSASSKQKESSFMKSIAAVQLENTQEGARCSADERNALLVCLINTGSLCMLSNT